MNRNDLYVFGLVSAMVVAVAAAIIARYPGANFGSVADWFAAAATTFAAVSALYIAHHEARRAREVLAEERAAAANKAADDAEVQRRDRMRSDAIVVQTALGALADGIESCLTAMKSLRGEQEPEDRANHASFYLNSHRLKVPTAEFALVAPSLAFHNEVTAWVLAAKSAWGACMSRMTLLANPTLSTKQAPIILKLDDVVKVLRQGYVLQWRLLNDQMTGPIPAEAEAEIDKRMPAAL